MVGLALRSVERIVMNNKVYAGLVIAYNLLMVWAWLTLAVTVGRAIADWLVPL